jgi:hypothetical protein
MKIAVCMYGQPRDYRHGNDCLKNLIQTNPDNRYEFFFHCWIDDNIKYECSPWSKSDEKMLYIKNQNEVKNELLELYHPISHVFEKPLDKTSPDIIAEFDHIEKSKAYSNGSTLHKTNTFNVFSQICSRGKVRDLFYEYIKTSNAQYDAVITTRFDGWDFPRDLKIPNIEKNKLYVSSIHQPRYIIPDNFLIMGVDVYTKVCNLYENMKRIINNDDIDIKMKSVNEKMVFNSEDILLASLFLSGFEVTDLVFSFY